MTTDWDINEAASWVLFALVALLGLGWVASVIRGWWRNS